MSSSSSESSEDDEIAQKIKAAVVSESFNLTPSTVGRQDQNGPTKQKTLKVNSNKELATSLKSNRPRDENDEDDGNILHTTPEFRSYVATQLSKMLDRELEGQVSDQVWTSAITTKEDSRGGIKLFCDSTTTVRLEDGRNNSETTQAESQKTHNMSGTARLKKRRLSTSSESSEDDKIKACVFTVNDIQQEVELLARFETPATCQESQNSITATTDSNCFTKQKKSLKSNVNKNSDVVIKEKKEDSEQVKRKKKKKKKDKSKSKVKGIT